MTLEEYPAQAKRLVSSVTRLRGWVGSDPTRQPELADELVRLTGTRLDVCAWAEAADDAQEAVTLAGRLLARHGSLGPYTPSEDAARFVTATVQLADVQTGLGLPEAASASLATARAVIEHLPSLALVSDPRTAERAALAESSCALHVGDIVNAQAWAEVAIATALTVSTTPLHLRHRALATMGTVRWASGDRSSALAWTWETLEHYRRLFVVDQPARMNPDRLRALTSPLVPTYSALVHRLADTGDLAWSTALAREAVERIRPVSDRLAEARTWAAEAQAALVESLVRDGRPREAVAAAGDVDENHPASEWVRRARVALGEASAADTEPETLTEHSPADARPSADVTGPFTAWFDAAALATETRRVVDAWASEAPRTRAHAEASERALQKAAEDAHATATQAEASAERVRAQAAAAEVARRAQQEESQREAEARRKAADQRETKRRRQERIQQHQLEAAVREAREAVAELESQRAAATSEANRDRIAERLEVAQHQLDEALATQASAPPVELIDDDDSTEWEAEPSAATEPSLAAPPVTSPPPASVDPELADVTTPQPEAPDAGIPATQQVVPEQTAAASADDDGLERPQETQDAPSSGTRTRRLWPFRGFRR